MDIKNLNSIIAKDAIDPDDLKVGMYVSRIDYEGKKIENRYFISSIKSKTFITPSVYKNKKKVTMIVKCFDIITDKFVNFTGSALLNFVKPKSTDFYDYQFTPNYENEILDTGDEVVFIEPKAIQMVIKRNKPRHVFMITKYFTDKYGAAFVNLIDGDGNYLVNIPIPFVKCYNKAKKINDKIEEMEEINNSYEKVETFKNKVEYLKNRFVKTLDLPKEFEENKKVNFGFSFSANDTGIKIEFYDQNHNSTSQTFIDFSKNDSDSTKQMIAKYVSALSMLSLSFNKINING